MVERRVAERFKPVEDCIVVHAKKIGNVRDISSSGLYCTCFQDSTCEKNVHKEIDLLCGYGKYLIKGLQVKIVETETIPGQFLKNFEIKKCRLQFMKMEQEQNSGLVNILTDACLS